MNVRAFFFFILFSPFILLTSQSIANNFENFFPPLPEPVMKTKMTEDEMEIFLKKYHNELLFILNSGVKQGYTLREEQETNFRQAIKMMLKVAKTKPDIEKAMLKDFQDHIVVIYKIKKEDGTESIRIIEEKQEIVKFLLQ